MKYRMSVRILFLSLLGSFCVLPVAVASDAEWASDINKAKFSEFNNNYSDAEQQLKDSIEKAKIGVPDKRATVISDIELGNLYIDWKKSGTADSFYKQAFERAKDIDDATLTYAISEALKHCQEAGDTELATRYSERFNKSVAKSGPNTPANFNQYMVGVRQRLRPNWAPATRPTPRKATVAFFILPDGSPVLTRLNSSSGDEDEDARAIDAVMNSAPFAKLPAGVARTGVPVIETFDYKPAPQLGKHPQVQIRRAHPGRKFRRLHQEY